MLLLIYIFLLLMQFLGSQVEVPTIDGKAKIRIPAGTQSGKIFRLKGKGFPSVNSYEKGDQLIHVNVWTPQQVSAEEKAMLEKLGDSPNFQPKPDKNEKSFFDKVKEMFSLIGKLKAVKEQNSSNSAL